MFVFHHIHFSRTVLLNLLHGKKIATQALGEATTKLQRVMSGQ
jgi:hypothetical protein